MAEKQIQETLPEVVQEQETQIARPEDVQGYHDGFTAEDVKIPAVLLMQKTSAMVETGEAEEGQFVNNVTQDNYGSELEFILLAQSTREIIRGRSRFVDNKMVCQSNDRVIGTGEPGGQCAACRFAQWTKDQETGRELPPKCAEGYTYLIYVVSGDGEFPSALRLSKTSMKTAKSFNLILKGMLRSISRRKAEPFGLVFKLYAEKESNAKGSYYVAKIKKARLAEDDERLFARELYEDFGGGAYTVEVGEDVDVVEADVVAYEPPAEGDQAY